jgi:hypothetical protein
VKLVTRFGATLEISPEDVDACREAGNSYFEREIDSAMRPGTYVKPSRVNRRVAGIRAERRRWSGIFADEASASIRDYAVADVLEWGRGTALCPHCGDVFPAFLLRAEEAFLDGVHRRRFFCPSAHLLWVFPENVMGAISDGEFDWRPIVRSAPWLPFL